MAKYPELKEKAVIVTSADQVDAAVGRAVELFGRLDCLVANAGIGKIAPGKAVPLGVYAMSKHAAIGLTKQLGVELAGDGILVNCICGGIVDTPMWDLIDREVTRRSGNPTGSFTSQAVESIPVGRIQKPEDMANAVVFLASDEGSYIAGQTLNCSGGLLPY